MTERCRRHSRRAFLALAGSGLAALPFLRAEESALAQAKNQGLERLITIYMPHGVARELWRPRSDFVIDYPDSSLAPFTDTATYAESFRDRLLVIEGLDLTAGIQGGSAGHDGSRVILTGSAGNGANASIDQYLAVDRGFGADTPLASLVLGVGNERAELGQCISYASGGNALSKIIDPSQTFQQAFAKWIVGADPEAQAELALARQRGQSALDAIRADLASLSARVGASESVKLDQHAASLREVEKRLAGFELSCEPPAAPVATSFPFVTSNEGGEPYFETITNLQIDLMAQALACGVTRFASLFLADLSHTGYDPVLPDDVHADCAHRYQASSDDAFTSGGNPASWSLLARQNRYCYQKIARLLAKLSSFGLLDTTLVVASSDMGDPAKHSSRSVPVIVAGGGSTFRLGRYLDARVAGAGVPNNRLLVSIANAFGIDVESYGTAQDPNLVNGALSGLT